MARADKAETVADLAERFRSASAALITEYRGLSTAQLTALRRSLGHGATYRIAKNTLVQRAASEAGIDGLSDLFVGPTAITFVEGEPVDAAKTLRDFSRDNRALVIKGGYMDGRPLTVAEVISIAELESREALLARLAGAMKGNLAKAAGLFAAPASQIARLAAALQEKRSGDQEPAADQAGADQTGADQTGADEPAPA